MDFPKNIKLHTIILIIISVISVTISLLLILDHTKSIPDIFNLHKQHLIRNSIEKYYSIDPVHSSIDPVHSSIDPVRSSIDPVRSSIDPVRSSIGKSSKLNEQENNIATRLTYFDKFDTKCISDNIDNNSLIDTIINCDLTTSYILNYCIRTKNIDTKLCG
jgi:hypothetical protein